MCGRYYIAEEDIEEKLRSVIEEINRRTLPQGFKAMGEIFPSDAVPVIANDRRLNRSAFAMRWGYARSDGKLVINARSETAAEKPMFADGMAQRRCIVPASRYFEWERHDTGKAKYAIRPAAPGLTCLAGIYRIRNGAAEFTILTRAPAPDIAFIHDRMPVILPETMTDAWLDPANRAEELLQEAVQELEYRRV